MEKLSNMVMASTTINHTAECFYCLGFLKTPLHRLCG